MYVSPLHVLLPPFHALVPGIIQSMGTYARTRKELLVTLERCKVDKKEREKNSQSRRDELELAKCQVDEQDLIFTTLQSAVENEKDRLIHLRRRYEQVQREHSELTSAFKSKVNPSTNNIRRGLVPQQIYNGNVTSANLRQDMNVRIQDEQRRQVSRQTTIAARGTTTKSKSLTSTKSKGSQTKTNQYVDIFGGMRHM